MPGPISYEAENDMASTYADDFDSIQDALVENQHLRHLVLGLVETEAVPERVTEGGDRLGALRKILTGLASGVIDLDEAILRTERNLPRQGSPYASDDRVFAEGWAEQLVRTQFSRFYNQAVLKQILALGGTECFVPHSSSEPPDSSCSQLLAGRVHDAQLLLDSMIREYRDGAFSKELKIPNHPHCTHVVRPVQ